MSSNQSKTPWEEWQLTAFLLGELEPELAAQIAAAAKQDPKLAEQLQSLSQTVADVQAVMGCDGQTASDQSALAALRATVTGAGDQPVKTVDSGYNWHRLVARWENWASLAGLLLIGVLLYQRPGREVVATKPTSGPAQTVVTPKAPGASTLDETVVHEAWNQSQPVQSQPTGELMVPVVGDFAVGMQPASRANPARAGEAKSEPSAEGPGGQPTQPVRPEALAQNFDGSRTMNYSLNRGYVAPGAVAPAKPQSAGPASNLSASNGQPAPGMGLMDGMGDMGGAMGGYGDAGMGMGDRMTGGSAVGGSAGGEGGGYGTAAMSGDILARAKASMGGGMGAGMGGGMNGGMGEEMVVRERGRFYDLEKRGEQPLFEKASGDRFTSFADNDFVKVGQQPLSTFSIDVDTAAYAKARQYLLEQRQLPPPAAVRIEEFINYFEYDYAGPKDDKPFAASLAVTQCPWQPSHQLVRIALQAKRVEAADRPKANLVFLLDVSGSMDHPNKLPLVKETMRLLTYQLTENDKVAMVVYAGAAGCVLESTHGHEQDAILAAIERLKAGGSTNGGQGIQLAYKIARDNFTPGGINRVILCTDGDFNVGLTSTEELVEMVKQQAQSNVFLTVLGYGNGNTNDAMMEQIADRGNGLYGFVDSRHEAKRQMVKQLAGNLMTVAKDVKIQVEFNPAKVLSYRLIGYENRQLAAEDFNNDKKDAGEIGAGHRVTAIYELVPVNEQQPDSEPLDQLRYQTSKRPEPAPQVKLEDNAVSNELMAVKVRYKQPEGSESQLLTFPLEDKVTDYAAIDQDFRWSAAVAEFGMLLRNSPHKGQSSWSKLSQRARAALGNPVDTTRAETLEMINAASAMSAGN